MMVSKSGQVIKCKQIREIYSLQETNQSSQNVFVGKYFSVCSSVKKWRKRKPLKNVQIGMLNMGV